MNEDELLRSSFIGIRNEPLPSPVLGKAFMKRFDRVYSKCISYCPDCTKFELDSCPFPDSDMRTTNCVHFDSKINYREVI
jgi:hypothetical protein